MMKKKECNKLLGHWLSKVKLTPHDELDLWIQINWEWHHLQSGTSGPTQSPQIVGLQSVPKNNDKEKQRKRENFLVLDKVKIEIVWVEVGNIFQTINSKRKISCKSLQNTTTIRPNTDLHKKKNHWNDDIQHQKMNSIEFKFFLMKGRMLKMSKNRYYYCLKKKQVLDVDRLSEWV
jgi:hypothetical protein